MLESFILHQWDEKQYCLFQELLSQNSEPEYALFQKKLIHDNLPILGIRIPALRNMAKRIIKGNWESFLEVVKDNSFEEVLLHGFVIAAAKMDFQKRLALIEKYLEKITNWAICDCFCSSLKDFSNYPERVFSWLFPYFSAKEEFKVRFAVIILLNYFITLDSIERTLTTLSQIRHTGYYVEMGIAWTLSMCFIKFEKQTVAVLDENYFSSSVLRKTYQKIVESNQVSDSTKREIRQRRDSLKQISTS